jgi:excisionase family DNA binding protein
MRDPFDRESQWMSPLAQPTTTRDDGRARAVIFRDAPIPLLWTYHRRTPPRSRVIPDARVQPVMTADEVFAELGIDRATGYKAIREGTFPLRVVRVGRLIRIPTAAVRRLLEIDDATGPSDIGIAIVEQDVA